MNKKPVHICLTFFQGYVKSIIYFMIILLMTSCSDNNSVQPDLESSNLDEISQSDERPVSLNFIGQTFSNKTTDSFGQTTQQFRFDQNGDGAFFVSWTVSNSLYQDSGTLSWKVKEGKVFIYYTYTASDGVSSQEEEVFIYNESSNTLISDNDNSIVFFSVPKITAHESNSFDEEEYNREREQAEYESSQAFYESTAYDNKSSSDHQSQYNSKISEPQGSGINTKNSVIEEPEFSGGYSAMMSFIQKNFNYPQAAIENNIQGKCYVKFYIENDGTVSNVLIERGVPGCPECDKEAIRVVKLMPRWIPGTVDGVKSRLRFTLPINFALD